MKPRSFQRQSLKLSLALHGTALVLMLVVPLILKACAAKKPNEKLMFVEFTVSIPPPPAPEVPEPPTAEPPKPPEPDPDDIKEVEKKPEVKPKPPEPPKPPAPPKDIRQTNRIVRKNAPLPKDKPLSEAEIAKLLKMGARIGDTTSIPADDQRALGAYYNHVHERMYAVWQQPSQLKSLPGLSTEVRITVAPDGRITDRSKIRGSGNDLMDDSVMKAVNSIKALRALPAGHRKPVDIAITFEISD
jgi:TonB family protein